MLFSSQNFQIIKQGQVVLSVPEWQIDTAQHWAIVGAVGTGKTSLLEALAGKGQVKGIWEYEFGKEQMAKNVVLVAKDYAGFRLVNQAVLYYQQRFNSQDAALAPTVRAFLTNQVRPLGTIYEASVVLPPPLVSEEQLSAVCALLRVGHLLDRPLTSLSNGETRRTLMTHALLKAPKLLLLDNPFVGLDVASRQILHEVLNGIMASGTQVVMVADPHEIPKGITHILSIDTDKTVELETKGSFLETLPLSYSTSPLIDENILQSFEKQEIPCFDTIVSMRKVNISYGSTQVLKDLDWTVKAGEKWALLGPNGSGKSTLLSLITADNPQSYANDFDLFDRKRGTGESIWDIKRNIGFVSPELHLYSPRTNLVFKAVASGLFDATGLYKKLTTAQTEQVWQALKLLKIEHLAEKTLLQCSTGQQRLVLLARALAKNPPLLILDEPCQGLDAEHIEQFKVVINRLCQNAHRSLIYVTHYTAEIPSCVDKILRL